MGNQNVIAHIYPRPIDILYELLAQQSYTLKKTISRKGRPPFHSKLHFSAALENEKKKCKTKEGDPVFVFF